MSACDHSRYKVSGEKAGRELVHALERFEAQRGSIVISSNAQVTRAGFPSGDVNVSDPGVAVYWTTRGNVERVLACDRWFSIYGNVRAIWHAVESLRTLERAGASQILDRAFTAFGALPAAPDAIPRRPWWEVLGFPESAIGALSAAVTDARHRELAGKAHPDRGGSDAAMAELNRARDEARAHYSK